MRASTAGLQIGNQYARRSRMYSQRFPYNVSDNRATDHLESPVRHLTRADGRVDGSASGECGSESLARRQANCSTRVE